MYTAMMAHSYSGDPYSVVGWYASRKLNGNRAIWNGQILQTLGRYSGSKIIYPPAWWSRSALPQGVPLDGELWHISDDKDIVRSIAGQGISKSVNDVRWADVRYMVFDYKPYSMYNVNVLPMGFSDNYLLNYKWEQRQYILKNNVVKHGVSLPSTILNNLFLCKQNVMKTIEDVQAIINSSKELNWEGVMFVNPEGLYTCDRSHDVLKSKPLFDHECFVNGIEPGEGKHLGKVGALQCFLTWNEQVTSFKGGRDNMIGQRVSFKVGGGISDDLRSLWMDSDKRPRAIRFSFLEVSKFGIPQSPNYLESV